MIHHLCRGFGAFTEWSPPSRREEHFTISCHISTKQEDAHILGSLNYRCSGQWLAPQLLATLYSYRCRRFSPVVRADVQHILESDGGRSVPWRWLRGRTPSLRRCVACSLGGNGGLPVPEPQLCQLHGKARLHSQVYICCNALCIVMFVRVPLFTVCFSHRVSW